MKIELCLKRIKVLRKFVKKYLADISNSGSFLHYFITSYPTQPRVIKHQKEMSKDGRGGLGIERTV